MGTKAKGLPWTLNVSEPMKDFMAADEPSAPLLWGAKKHEWNTDFAWRAAKAPFRYLSDDQARSWNENGYFLMEKAFDPAELERLTAAIDPLEAEAEEYLRNHLGGKAFIARAGEITFTNHLAAKSAVVRNLVLSDAVLDVCHDVVGPDCRMYWDMSVYKKPGTLKPFPWHQDNGYTFIEPQQYVTFWMALTDATLLNGCPWVLPGWHRHGTLAHKLTSLGFNCFEEEPEYAVALPVPAGSIAVFSSLTPHATGSNVTRETRKTYILEVAPDGAETLRREKDGSLTRTPCSNPRQFPILQNGNRVAAE